MLNILFFGKINLKHVEQSQMEKWTVIEENYLDSVQVAQSQYVLNYVRSVELRRKGKRMITNLKINIAPNLFYAEGAIIHYITKLSFPSKFISLTLTYLFKYGKMRQCFRAINNLSWKLLLVIFCYNGVVYYLQLF